MRVLAQQKAVMYIQANLKETSALNKLQDYCRHIAQYSEESKIVSKGQSITGDTSSLPKKLTD
jgi:hypothetical protein